MNPVTRFISRTNLGPITLHDDTPNASEAPANTSVIDGKNTSATTSATQSPADKGETITPATNADTPADDTPLQLTQAQLDAKIAASIAGYERNREAREAKKSKREQNQTARQAAEADGDTTALLEVERTEHAATREELATAHTDAANAVRELAVFRAAVNNGLDANLTDLLTANSRVTDQATADAEAKKLAAYKETPTAPNNDAGSGNRPTPKKAAPPVNGAAPAQAEQGERFSFQSPTDVAWPS